LRERSPSKRRERVVRKRRYSRELRLLDIALSRALEPDLPRGRGDLEQNAEVVFASFLNP
jgi:hypothetical protein